MAGLEQKQRTLWRRAWGFGLAAAAVALLVMLALRPGRAPVAVRTNRSLTVAALSPAVRETVSPPQPHRKVARRVVRPTIVPDTPYPEPLIVKLQTDDPNVVIYWIADRKKGD
jgi:hypothetical protein